MVENRYKPILGYIVLVGSCGRLSAGLGGLGSIQMGRRGEGFAGGGVSFKYGPGVYKVEGAALRGRQDMIVRGQRNGSIEFTAPVRAVTVYGAVKRFHEQVDDNEHEVTSVEVRGKEYQVR
jgi:hypothetical protein